MELDPKKEEKVAGIFQRLREVELEAPAFLETRVLAQHRERSRENRKVIFWRNATIGSTVFSFAVAIAFLFHLKQPEFNAFVNQPFVVRITVTDLKSANIARAEILLPEGVYFDLEGYPGLKEQRKLSLKWLSTNTEFFPFVLNSHEGGSKTVVVRFFDEKDTLVKEKRLTIRLKETT